MGDGPPRFPRDFSCPAVLGVTSKVNQGFVYGAITLYGRTFQTAQLPFINPHVEAPQPRNHLSNFGLGCSAFARHYLRNHYCFLFLRVLRCFSSPRSPHVAMYSPHDDKALPLPGFPIRTSPDQSLFNGSPRLFAAYHVLHRLSLPRHPPYALCSLTIKNRNQSKNIQSSVKTQEHKCVSTT